MPDAPQSRPELDWSAFPLPAYLHDYEAETIALGEDRGGLVSVGEDGTEYPGRLQFELAWSPSPRVQAKFHPDEGFPAALFMQQMVSETEADVQAPSYDLTFKAWCRGGTLGFIQGKPSWIRLQPKTYDLFANLSGGASASVVQFHVLNMDQLHRPLGLSAGCVYWIRRGM